MRERGKGVVVGREKEKGAIVMGEKIKNGSDVREDRSGSDERGFYLGCESYFYVLDPGILYRKLTMHVVIKIRDWCFLSQ